MSKTTALARRTKAELVRLARRRGIRDCEKMNKAALLNALSGAAAAAARTAAAKRKTRTASPAAEGVPVKSAAKVTTARRATRSRRTAAPEAASRRTSRAKPAPTTVKATAKPTAKMAAAPPTPPKPTGNGQVATPTPPAPTPSAPTPPAVKGKATSAPKSPAPTPAAATGTTPPAKSPTPSRISPPAPRSVPLPKDRLLLAVTDPYWLHVMWELSPQSIQRAEAALKQDWYGAKLTLRLLDVTSPDTTSAFETIVQEIPVEPDGHNWYIFVPQPPRSYRVDIGYMPRRGEFFVLARSNVVTTPKAGASETLETTWEADPKSLVRPPALASGLESLSHPEVKSLYEDRLRLAAGLPRPVASGLPATGQTRKFFFDLDAKLIVYGRTDPHAHLTLGNDPVELRPDGTFVMEFSLPDSRQIIPAVATSADGVEERTVILAIERNTKYLEPIIHDQTAESKD